MIDVNAFVSEYTSNKTHTLKTISAAYGIKPADAAALLRLHGITIRRGAPNGISEEARAKARETQHAKALARSLTKLVHKYGSAETQTVLAAVIVNMESTDNADA